MTSDDEWPDLITHYRTHHNLTQAQFAERINVTQQTVSRWESGKQRPDPSAKQILRTALGLTALSSTLAWRDRVAMTWGTEALFEKDWRILALSPKLREIIGEARDFVGTSLFDIPAFHDYRAIMNRLPFFEGGIRVMKARIEIPQAGAAYCGDIELWPVMSGSDEILAHAVMHLIPSTMDTGAATIREFFALTTDGREILPGGSESPV